MHTEHSVTASLAWHGARAWRRALRAPSASSPLAGGADHDHVATQFNDGDVHLSLSWTRRPPGSMPGLSLTNHTPGFSANNGPPPKVPIYKVFRTCGRLIVKFFDGLLLFEAWPRNGVELVAVS